MSRTWAVARQMIAEGIRMKIALVFLVLLGSIVLGLPGTVKGDSTLTGAVQSFLSYSLTATGVLLGMLTVFMSRSLADELVNRQIYLLMTKPIPRWQFIIGKWLGTVILNFIFLVFAGLTIYAMVHYIRYTHPPLDTPVDASQMSLDETELLNEVLVARHARPCKLPDFRRPAEAELERNIEEGAYDNLPSFSRDAEFHRLTLKYEAKWRVVPPQDSRKLLFDQVLCDRSPDNVVQLRYKSVVSQYPPDEIFRSMWQVGDPKKGTALYQIPTRHVVGRFHAVRIPADAVAPDNTLQVQFFNINPYPGEPQFRNVLEFRKSDGIELLFVVGPFGWNLVRLLVLMMCKLTFLAALAFLMVTLFSFPVACLSSFTVYLLAGTRRFILEALDFASNDFSTMFDSVYEFAMHVIIYVYQIVHWVVPDFSRYDAIETFVNGRNVGLVWVLQGVADLVIVKCGIVLGLALLFFHRREVAEVSV